VTYSGPPDRPSDAGAYTHLRRVPDAGSPLPRVGPPRGADLRAGDGLARGRSVFGAARGTWRYAANEYVIAFSSVST